MWLFTPATISYLAQLTLALIIAVYLVNLTRNLRQQQDEVAVTRLLSLFFFSVAVYTSLLLLNVSLQPTVRLIPLYWQTPAVALVFLFLLQFVYRYPTPITRPRWERHVVLSLSIAYTLWESWRAVRRWRLLAVQDVQWMPELTNLFPLVFAVWLLIVLIRQTIRASHAHRPQLWWQALLYPQGRQARTTRTFLLIFASLPLLNLLDFARGYYLITNEIREIAFSLGILMMMFFFALAYLNTLSGMTTFIVRLVGIPLVTTLTIVGAIGWLIFQPLINESLADPIPQQDSMLSFDPNRLGGYDISSPPLSFETDLGDRLAVRNDSRTPLDLPFPFTFYGQTYQTIYILDDGAISFGQPLDWKDAWYFYGPTPTIMPLLADFNPNAEDGMGGVYARSSPDRLVITWHRLPLMSQTEGPFRTVQVSLYADGRIEMAYPDLQVRAPDIYSSSDITAVIGITPGIEAAEITPFAITPGLTLRGTANSALVDNLSIRLRREVHTMYSPLVALVLISSLIVLVIYPAFFTYSLSGPLNMLLDGVRRVNGGDLKVEMPVRFRDEIGFLTTSFNNMVVQLRALVTDLEERVAQRTRQLEQQTLDLAQARDDAEAANRAKSVFLANMSHELRTPLNAIIGFSEMMSSDITLSPTQRQNLEIVNRSGEHLLAIINDVLELSKIEAGRITFQPHPFDLYQLLEDMIRMFEPRTRKKGISLVLTFGDAVPHHISTDQGKLRQVLINLLGNAVKFTNQGHIEMRVSRLPLDRDETGRCVLQFEISDSGIGIPEAQQESIFNAFAQADEEQINQNGSGLGLTISQEFVRLMGGEITVSSKPGHGSVFRFEIDSSLPPGDEWKGSLTDGPERVVGGLMPGQPRYRLLVVEDVAESRNLLAQMLTGWGFEVRTAENGKEAIRIYEDWNPQLVWMDIRMPVMNGYEASQYIKGTPSGPSTPIIALTANVFEVDRDRVLACGCDDFMRKPFRQTDIARHLETHLGAQFSYVPRQASPTLRPPVTETAQGIDLSALPTIWAANLHQAAIEADGDKIRALAGEIKETYPEQAAALTALSNQFDYTAILHALEQHTHEAHHD